VGIKSDGFEASKKTVLALVITLCGILIAETLEARVGKTFVIVAPADTPILEKIDYGRDVPIHEDKAVAVQAEGITAGRSDVVGLTRSSDTIISGQKYALIDKYTAVG
jgi:hypothetical protein